MQGSSGTRRGLVHLIAGAALGAAAVLVVWIFSGGDPFGEVVGNGSVSAPTTAAVQKTDVQKRTTTPANAQVRLGKAPPSLGGSGELQFKRPAAERRAEAKAKAAKAERAKAKARRTRRARKPVVRVVSPPSSAPAQEVPVAVVPSPAATPAPAPPAPAPAGGGGEPVKRRAPTLSVGAGEG